MKPDDMPSAPRGFAPPAPASLSLGVVGNCAFSALVDPHGRVVWSCLPRFDGDPVFHALLEGDDAEHLWTRHWHTEVFA